MSGNSTSTNGGVEFQTESNQEPQPTNLYQYDPTAEIDPDDNNYTIGTVVDFTDQSDETTVSSLAPVPEPHTVYRVILSEPLGNDDEFIMLVQGYSHTNPDVYTETRRWEFTRPTTHHTNREEAMDDDTFISQFSVSVTLHTFENKDGQFTVNHNPSYRPEIPVEAFTDVIERRYALSRSDIQNIDLKEAFITECGEL